MQMAAFLEGMGSERPGSRTALNSYVLMLEKEGKAASTVSRNLASMKGVFRIRIQARADQKRIRQNPSMRPGSKKGSGDSGSWERWTACWPSRRGILPRRSGIRLCWSSFTPTGSAYRADPFLWSFPMCHHAQDFADIPVFLTRPRRRSPWSSS